jgi:hypothetical protein
MSTLVSTHRMLRAAACLIVILVLAAFLLVARGFSQTTIDLEAARIGFNRDIEFDKHWGAYLMSETGCPAPPAGAVAWSVSKADCNRPTQLNLRERKLARELAKQVFDLDEPTKPR